MNDPWPLLVAVLSGQRTAIPSTWPVRTVHRLDSYAAAPRRSDDRQRALHRGSPVPLAT